MSEAKHTPGPWEHAKTGARLNSHPFGIYANDAPAGRKMPALTDTEANARLIAAAPDLLAACEALLGAINHANGYDDLLVIANRSGWAAEYMNPACDFARSVVAAAKGEQ